MLYSYIYIYIKSHWTPLTPTIIYDYCIMGGDLFHVAEDGNGAITRKE